MADPAQLFRNLSRLPGLGPRIFSQLVMRAAPYSASIAPRFRALQPGYVEVAMKKRRAVENHLGTVHAIAMCNLCELAAGTMMEATLPRSLRWIPRAMTVRYLHKAETDLLARAQMAAPAPGFRGDLLVQVLVHDLRARVVMEADISMYVSPRKEPSPEDATD